MFTVSLIMIMRITAVTSTPGLGSVVLFLESCSENMLFTQPTREGFYPFHLLRRMNSHVLFSLCIVRRQSSGIGSLVVVDAVGGMLGMAARAAFGRGHPHPHPPPAHHPPRPPHHDFGRGFGPDHGWARGPGRGLGRWFRPP